MSLALTRENYSNSACKILVDLNSIENGGKFAALIKSLEIPSLTFGQ